MERRRGVEVGGVGTEAEEGARERVGARIDVEKSGKEGAA